MLCNYVFSVFSNFFQVEVSSFMYATQWPAKVAPPMCSIMVERVYLAPLAVMARSAGADSLSFRIEPNLSRLNLFRWTARTVGGSEMAVRMAFPFPPHAPQDASTCSVAKKSSRAP